MSNIGHASNRGPQSIFNQALLNTLKNMDVDDVILYTKEEVAKCNFKETVYRYANQYMPERGFSFRHVIRVGYKIWRWK